MQTIELVRTVSGFTMDGLITIEGVVPSEVRASIYNALASLSDEWSYLVAEHCDESCDD